VKEIECPRRRKGWVLVGKPRWARILRMGAKWFYRLVVVEGSARVTGSIFFAPSIGEVYSVNTGCCQAERLEFR